MIQLKARKIPEDLALGQLQWTADLNNLVKKYGTYKKIPDVEKSAVLKNYNIAGVKKELKEMSKGKCCYCESKIEHVDFPHIEHYWPKSRYHKFAFIWSNLFLSCSKCNIPKSEFDTKKKPFINPVIDNPEEYLSYSELRIVVNSKTPNRLKSENTINHCDLRRTHLFRLRADLRIAFNELEDDLEIISKEYFSLTQNPARLKRALKILNSLENLKKLCSIESQYAGYVRFMTRNSVIANNAIGIINQNLEGLGEEENFILI